MKFFLSEFMWDIELYILWADWGHATLNFKNNATNIRIIKDLVWENNLYVDTTQWLAYKEYWENVLWRSFLAYSLRRSNDIMLKEWVIFLNKKDMYSL